MDIQALTDAISPENDAGKRSLRRAKKFEKLMRPKTALEALMREREQIERLMRPSPPVEAAMQHVRQLEELMRPSPAMEAAMQQAKQLAELTRPSPAIEAAMQHAKRLAELTRPSPAIEAAMQHAKHLEELMRPSAAFEEFVRQAAQIPDMLSPSRALRESLQRTKDLAAALRPEPAFEESLCRTRELVEAASIGNALRDFIWQGISNQHAGLFPDATSIADDEPNTDEPQLIISHEFGAQSLSISDGVLIRGCAPSLVALRRLFSKGVDLGKINWRELEEIVGELLSLDGYNVEVGRGTKDRGIDVLASKVLPHVGLLRTVWQAKHLKPGNKVALKTIRELADIRDKAGATKGIIVTTGFLTAGALQRIRQDAYCLEKVERPELEDWIRRSLSRST